MHFLMYCLGTISNCALSNHVPSIIHQISTTSNCIIKTSRPTALEVNVNDWVLAHVLLHSNLVFGVLDDFSVLKDFDSSQLDQAFHFCQDGFPGTVSPCPSETTCQTGKVQI